MVINVTSWSRERAPVDGSLTHSSRRFVRRDVFPPRASTEAIDPIAHRGFVDAGPENALPTLRRATATADAVEFDVRLAREGEPVVFHDRRVGDDGVIADCPDCVRG